MMVTTLGVVFIATALTSLLGYPEVRRRGVLGDYLLAGGGLTRVPVLNLLVSTSFGLNTMFYQGYLGATVGYWGLVVQLAWAGGFFLLRGHVDAIREYHGLHHFLGRNFGITTQVVTALFSLTGITFFLGWETSIGTDTLAGILTQSQSVVGTSAQIAAEWLVFGITVGCLLYTLLGGLRGNAKANIVQNVLKFVTFGYVTYLLWHTFSTTPGASFWSAFVPSRSIMEANLGWWGVITSIAFGLVWQFVDMSTWQSIAASSLSSDDDLRWNLKWSGILVFITPGVLGTIFGVFLSNIPDAATNVLIAAAKIIPATLPIVQALFIAAIISSIMSLIDGLFLASTYALIIDIIHRNKTLEELDHDEVKAARTLALARALLTVVGAVSIWGIPWAISLLGDRNIFFFSFVVVVAQLAIYGPVFIALKRRSSFTDTAMQQTDIPMWASIVISGIIGFTSAFYGGIHNMKFLTDGAGTFTIIVSVATAWYLEHRWDRRTAKTKKLVR